MSKEWKCKDCVKYGTDACFNGGRFDYDECKYKLIDSDYAYEQGRADAIEEYEQRLLEDLIPLKDKYFDIAKGTSMPERYAHLKRMDTVDLIIEMVSLKAEQLKEQK